jgi:hypothetical protein
MKQLHGIARKLAGICTILLLTGGSWGVAQADKTARGLAADHVIACIKTAVEAQAGLVNEVEVEYEGARWLCEVKVVDQAGKRHKLHVDVATNQIVEPK